MDTRIAKFSLTSALAALIFTIGSAQADDTDVYMNPGAGLPANSEPMVMFSLDYRPNLGSTACNGSECDMLIAEGYLPLQASYTFFDVLRAALRKVFDPLDQLVMFRLEFRQQMPGQHRQGILGILQQGWQAP